MLELHTTEPKRWDVSRLASSFGITAERVNAILYYQRKEQEARKVLLNHLSRESHHCVWVRRQGRSQGSVQTSPYGMW